MTDRHLAVALAQAHRLNAQHCLAGAKQLRDDTERERRIAQGRESYDLQEFYRGLAWDLYHQEGEHA